ncbi:MAG: ester cyclase [Pyrinomonadaceae bacterium]
METKMAADELFLHRWFEEVWNRGSQDAIDEMVATDVRIQGLTDVEGNDVRGIDNFKLFHENFRNAFPDLRVTVEDVLCDGDKMAARCRIIQTHTGDGLGISPTNAPIEFSGMCIVRLENGKIAEAWNNFDFLSMYQQMGLIGNPVT